MQSGREGSRNVDSQIGKNNQKTVIRLDRFIHTHIHTYIPIQTDTERKNRINYKKSLKINKTLTFFPSFLPFFPSYFPYIFPSIPLFLSSLPGILSHFLSSNSSILSPFFFFLRPHSGNLSLVGMKVSHASVSSLHAYHWLSLEEQKL